MSVRSGQLDGFRQAQEDASIESGIRDEARS